MKRRFVVRKEELLAECEVPPALFDGLLERLHQFVQPFAEDLHLLQQPHAQTYVAGLLSDLKRKNAEAIAYRYDQDRDGLQHFLGVSSWDYRPLLHTLADQVGKELGQADAVLVFDPSGFAKKGIASVGVARQWLGRLGKVDNGQLGIYLGYVSRKEHALVDVRLYLPKEWTNDRKRCQRAGVPKEEIRYRTRHALSLEMLAVQGPRLPHAWVAGDDEMGRSSRFRKDLRDLGERYLLAVPSNTSIRDLQAPPPAYAGYGGKPKRRFEPARAWAAARAEEDWTAVEVRDGEKGPLAVQLVAVRVQARTDRRAVGPEEVLVVIRAVQEDGTWKYDYYLSNAAAETPLAEWARVAKAEHRIEECLQRGKSEAGLADYEVRTWVGWHHHQSLSLLASWFLVKESLRGKQWAPAVSVPQIRTGLAQLLHEATGCGSLERIASACRRRLQRTALARFYYWKKRNRLAPLRVNQRC